MKRAHFVPDNNFLDDVRSIRTKAQEYLLCQTLLNEGGSELDRLSGRQRDKLSHLWICDLSGFGYLNSKRTK